MIDHTASIQETAWQRRFQLVLHCRPGLAATLSSAPPLNFVAESLIVHKKIHVLADHVKFDNMLHCSILVIAPTSCPRSGLCEGGACSESNYISATRSRVGMVVKHAQESLFWKSRKFARAVRM
jgi:hypothetical protein